MRIGIDLLGSDASPTLLFPAILQAAKRAPQHTTFVVFVTKEARGGLDTSASPENVHFHEVEEFISMEDDPILSVRKKKHSSLVVAMCALKRKEIDALVSAGNTGALITAATLIMPKLPDIKRPALLAQLPTLKEPLTVIDVGGNVSYKASHLVQFAHLGAAHYCRTHNKAKARVGLLNIGAEPKKGTSELRRAYKKLKHSSDLHASSQIEFVGNIEARDIFNGFIDVLVTDGFTGNILLKTSEGVSSFIFDYIKTSGLEPVKEAAALAQKAFDHTEHPGALVCGTEGLIIKCHGNTTETSLFHAIMGAITQFYNTENTSSKKPSP